uniref:Uncharacterized protein n=1 Tax=Arundo donax TaxID=35708 RepID=A0A0A9B8Q7_ARUDO
MSEDPFAAAGCCSPSGWETMALRSSLAAVGFREEGCSGGSCCCRLLSGPACCAWELVGASPPRPWSACCCIIRSLSGWIGVALARWSEVRSDQTDDG